MRSKTQNTADPGRRNFIKQVAAAGLFTAVTSRFSIAHSASTDQRETNKARAILMNGKFTTLDPTKPRATAVAINKRVGLVAASHAPVSHPMDCYTGIEHRYLDG